MKNIPDPELIDDENPEWTEAMFSEAVIGAKFLSKKEGALADSEAQAFIDSLPQKT